MDEIRVLFTQIRRRKRLFASVSIGNNFATRTNRVERTFGSKSETGKGMIERERERRGDFFYWTKREDVERGNGVVSPLSAAKRAEGPTFPRSPTVTAAMT